MKLSEEEQAMLDGIKGPSVSRAMELLVALGDCYEADRMVRIGSAHLVGPNPVTAGRGGTAFYGDLAKEGAQVTVPTTTNPISLDVWSWAEMGFGKELYSAQISLSEHLSRMGVLLCNTCTPYLAGHVPRFGEHVAWGESSAVLYLNSVLGARTNREGAPSALAAAITGRSPAYGLHLDENRYGQILVENRSELRNDTDYSTLGYYIGKFAQDRIPIITGITPSITADQLKSLGTPLAVTGSVALYHVVGVTPEAPSIEIASGSRKIAASDTISVGSRELKETEASLSAIHPDKGNLVILGCPHASITQLKDYARTLAGKRIRKEVEVWILSTRTTRDYAAETGILEALTGAGAKVVWNVCPNAMPHDFFAKQGYTGVVTDSPKMAYYVTATKGVSCYYGSLQSFVGAIIR